MMFKQKQFNTTYSESRVLYNETKTDAVIKSKEIPNVIDVILEPLRPQIFKPNGKVNIWWVLWNIGKLLGTLLAAFDERDQERNQESYNRKINESNKGDQKNFCTIKTFKGKQFIHLPSGEKIPKQIKSTIIQNVGDELFPIVRVQFEAFAKVEDSI